MLEKFIKNRTPYLGKIRLSFDKNPHWSGGDGSRLNSIILDLGWTKLVSRIIPTKTGWAVDPAKVALINKYTDGIITDYNLMDGCLLTNSFLTKTGEYIGSIDEGWWFLQNGMTVCEDFPRGVALKWRTTRSDKTVMSGTDGLLGYYGYSHRGGSLFKIGDRVFDPKYRPKPADFRRADWTQWENAWTNRVKSADSFDLRWLEKEGIASVIPFNQRGAQQIMNWAQAKEAAIRLSKHLS